MHDWTLDTITIHWKERQIILDLRSPSGPKQLIATGFSKFLEIGNSPWGRSVSINEVIGPTPTAAGSNSLKIEMQSGDVIELEAASIDMPKQEV